MTALYIPPFLWGLTGGFSHCIGMCGIFVVSYANLADTSGGKRHSNKAAHLLFHCGRLIAFVVLGGVAGTIGSLVGFHDRVPKVQGCVAIGAGIMLAIFSIGQIGLAPRLRIPEPNVMEMGGGRIRKIYARTIRSRAFIKPAVLGMLVGLLPCGLTYYALLYVLGSMTTLQGMLAMALFALGSAVGLLTFGAAVGTVGTKLRSPRFRNALGRWSGVVMMTMAVILIYRGAEMLHSL